MKIVNMNGISDARGKKNRILVLIVIPEQLAHLINLNYNRPLSTKKYTFAKSVGFMESDKVDSSDRTELEDSSPRKDTKGKDKSDESGSGKMMISQMSSPYLHRRKVDVGDVESSDDVLTEAGHKRVDKLEEWLSGNIAEFINFIQTYSTSGDREKRWAIIRYIQRQTSIFSQVTRN